VISTTLSAVEPQTAPMKSVSINVQTAVNKQWRYIEVSQCMSYLLTVLSAKGSSHYAAHLHTDRDDTLYKYIVFTLVCSRNCCVCKVYRRLQKNSVGFNFGRYNLKLSQHCHFCNCLRINKPYSANNLQVCLQSIFTHTLRLIVQYMWL
jgi:hypothetical protein